MEALKEPAFFDIFFNSKGKGLRKCQRDLPLRFFLKNLFAGVAELVDAYVSGAYARKGVGVRVPPPAQVDY